MTAPVLTFPLLNGGSLTVPNPPATDAMRERLDRIEVEADKRDRQPVKEAA